MGKSQKLSSLPEQRKAGDGKMCGHDFSLSEYLSQTPRCLQRGVVYGWGK